MAKSKKSRRARRQETQRKKQTVAGGPAIATEPTVSDTDARVATVDVTAPAAENVKLESSIARKAVDFASEYFYVYKELRTIIIIAIMMFVVMAGLSFVI